MSTRCHVGFYESDTQAISKPTTLIYRHSDGYPSYKQNDGEYNLTSGMLPCLLPFLKDFRDRRGLDDMEYLPAWLLHHMIQAHVTHTARWRRDWQRGQRKRGEPVDKPLPTDDGRDMLGYGICGGHGFHGDIQWLYRVTPTTLSVHSPKGRWVGREYEDFPAERWPVTIEIDLKKSNGLCTTAMLKQAETIPVGSFKAKGVKDDRT